jgi:hypothetical protein
MQSVVIELLLLQRPQRQAREISRLTTVGSGTAVRKLHRQHKNLCNGGRNTWRGRHEEQAMRRIFIALCLTLVATLAVADGSLSLLLAQHMGPQSEQAQKDAMTPEERMNRRFPQPVRVGDLMSLRVLDDQDVTIGFVRRVVRTPQGKILLLVSQGGWLGWGERLVAAPIEVMAIFGRQLASLDMEPKEYASASTWAESDGTPIPDDEIIRIALTRR